MAFFKVLTFLAMATIVYGYPPGYSYSRFTGPVSGHESEVVVNDAHGHGHKVDYTAKPDYHFAYGVDDPKSQVQQSRKETRVGDTVHGEYSVVDPDGTHRLVKYTADKHNGFQAEIITDGKSAGIQGHPQAAAPSHSYSTHSDESGDDEDY